MLVTEEQTANLGLTFRQEMDKVKFTTILAVRRLEDPLENIDPVFVYFDEGGMHVAAVDPALFLTPESRLALRLTMQERIVDTDAHSVFLVLTAQEAEGSIEWGYVLGISAKAWFQAESAPLTRRRFGNPLLGRWVPTSNAPFRDLMVPLHPFLKRV
jgi:hypothetical protein